VCQTLLRQDFVRASVNPPKRAVLGDHMFWYLAWSFAPLRPRPPPNASLERGWAGDRSPERDDGRTAWVCVPGVGGLGRCYEKIAAWVDCGGMGFFGVTAVAT
jgi:hypothetical protein